MAIEPIYIQATLGRQDDVSKAELKREQTALRKTLSDEERARELERKRVSSVDETLEENSVDKIGEDEQERRRKRRNLRQNKEEQEEQKNFYKDQNLGKNIDISV